MAASIRCGPDSAKAQSSASASSSAVPTLGGAARAGAHAHAFGHLHEIHCGRGQVEQRLRFGAGDLAIRLGADALQFDPQDVVGAVGIDHRGDVEVFAGLGP
jgi:hypothetical protein